MTLDVDVIRSRADAATPGPWEAITTGRAGGDHWYVTDSGEAIASIHADDGNDEDRRQPDAEFIAHAREDIPALLAHVAQLKDRIAARDRASLAALFLADAMGIENVEAEIEKAKAAAAAPYLEQIAALQDEKTPTPDDTRIATLEHAVIESALALHHVAGAPADTVYQASRTLYRNTIALAEALKENTP